MQREGGPIEEIRPGDVVWFAPGEKHWHGASPTTAMTHIAIQEALDGKVVEWMEHVTDEQYRANAASADIAHAVNDRSTDMKGAVLHGPRDVRFEERADPTIVEPTDAIIRLSATCVCGSDLWPYRGANPMKEPTPMGHEYCGIVEEVGSAVTTREDGAVRHRLVLRVRQHVPALPATATRRRVSTRSRSSARRRRCCASRSPTARSSRRATSRRPT